MPSLAVYTHPVLAEHDPGPHPECPERYRVCREGLAVLEGLEWHESSPPATDAELERAHSRTHVERLAALAGRSGQIDADTIHSPRTVEAARLASGAAVAAARAVWAGELERAFCLLRPPGHHATHDRAMGFCFLNHVAVAARALRDAGAERLLIIDWDVHHGNGTQDIFYDDPQVFYYSLHQSPHYPGTGSARETGHGRGEGRTLNRPLPARCPVDRYRELFAEDLGKIQKTFAPELTLISAGFDAHRLDPLGGFLLEDEDFSWLTRVAVNAQAGGRVLSLLEGGYRLEALASSVEAHVRALRD